MNNRINNKIFYDLKIINKNLRIKIIKKIKFVIIVKNIKKLRIVKIFLESL